MDATISLLLIPFVILGGGIDGSTELVDFAQPEAHWKAQGAKVSDDVLIARLSTAKVGDLTPLIRQLGSGDFQTRESAAQTILNKGAGAIPQLKKHLEDEDLEVASRAKKLIDRLQTSDVDRLIAIRVLGQRKSKAAIPALKALTTSKEPFVTEHAKRALAWIEGRSYEPPPVDPKLLDKDLWLLPKSCIVVAQTTFRGGKPYDVGQLYKELPFINQAGQKQEDIQKQLHEMITNYLKLIGNIRIDAITVGWNGSFDEDSSTIVAVARGLYARKKLKDVAGKQPGATARAVGDIDVIEHEYGALIMPSDQIAIMVYGKKNVRQAMIKAAKEGVGTLREHKAIAKLIESVDRKSGGWAALKLTKEMKEQYWLTPYASIIAHRSVNKDGRPSINITCHGADAEQVNKTAMRFAMDIKAAEQLAIQAVQQGQFPQSVLELVQSVKVDIEKANAKVTFHAPKGLDTVMTSIAFFPAFALLAGDDFMNF